MCIYCTSVQYGHIYKYKVYKMLLQLSSYVVMEVDGEYMDRTSIKTKSGILNQYDSF